MFRSIVKVCTSRWKGPTSSLTIKWKKIFQLRRQFPSSWVLVVQWKVVAMGTRSFSLAKLRKQQRENYSRVLHCSESNSFFLHHCSNVAFHTVQMLRFIKGTGGNTFCATVFAFYQPYTPIHHSYQIQRGVWTVAMNTYIIIKVTIYIITTIHPHPAQLSNSTPYQSQL